ncbi:Smx2p [Saccharomyces cerevisiae P301]|uniref:Small nuclear ribonucleoprotein G n=1 Tax=Saccharomyces cerevisiae (strain Lalvin EC1118 / Prise de mousse) TaxID=643680 RepID=C8Z7R6_YEAS8|nr:Smx2p [Saccharomyces cerevisiae P301]CAI7277134.1 CKB_collapsed_G0017310.mRNA.1.CDS.1 [Saccharomyces cerevisiae]CAY79432.1 Smx2p [Saccharomyces cerevisiae EC1118]
MVSTPELKKYMDKKILLNINGSRKVAGILRGYDIFLNVVLDDAMEINGEDPANNHPLGLQAVIRGNSIISLEALDAI